MLGLAIALFLAVAGLLLLEQNRGISRNGRRLPRPPGTLPLAGYGLWFLQPRQILLSWLAEIQPRMGLETFELPVPSLPPAVIVNDPKNLEFVLKNHDLFVKGDFFRSRSWDLFANGILNSDGELWKIQRKAGLRFLTNANLRSFIDDVLPPFLTRMTDRLDAAYKSNSIIDLQEELLDVTTRLFGRVAFDMDVDPSMPFSRAFDEAAAVTNSRFTNPFWRLQAKFFGRSFYAAIAQVRSFGTAVVASAQLKLDDPSLESKTLPKNLITSLLAHISDHQTVADAAVNFLSAGRDTTAQSMTWAIYSLLKNPDARRELVDSLSSTFKGYTHDQPLPLTYELITSPHALLYTNAVFNEALRLNPAIPLEFKETTDSCILPDGTNLPKGAVVVWIPYAMARSPPIWGPDAALFKPERWLDTNEEGQTVLLQRSAFENPVFNAGPRMCIGKRMAEVLAVRVLAELAWSWEFEEVDRGPRIIGEALTAPMQGGLHVRVRRFGHGQTPPKIAGGNLRST